jgi:putative toxin-antitoxin system antitoxin component (TIGR02293 family)
LSAKLWLTARRCIVEAAQLKLEMTPARAVERLEGDLGLTRGELAAALDATPRTLERWRAGATHPQRDARRRLAALLNLDEHLRDTFTDSEAAREWLRAPNPYLGGLTPADALRAGRADRVEAALEALDSGVFV